MQWPLLYLAFMDVKRHRDALVERTLRQLEDMQYEDGDELPPIAQNSIVNGPVDTNPAESVDSQFKGSNH